MPWTARRAEHRSAIDGARVCVGGDAVAVREVACKPSIPRHTIGILCGAGAAMFWAAGFTAARHGIDVGFSPADITFHRCVWAGLLLLPLFLRDSLGDLNGVGWWRGIVLAILGGPGIAIISYSGFLLVPLGHAGVIQPSCAALFGILLASVRAEGAARRRRAFSAR